MSAALIFCLLPLLAQTPARPPLREVEHADWEQELADFYHTDVEVTAKLTVDGRTYQNVGAHFRGNASYSKVGAGRKRSLGLSIDYVDDEQQLGDYRTVNLLNSHGDPT